MLIPYSNQDIYQILRFDAMGRGGGSQNRRYRSDHISNRIYNWGVSESSGQPVLTCSFPRMCGPAVAKALHVTSSTARPPLSDSLFIPWAGELATEIIRFNACAKAPTAYQDKSQSQIPIPNPEVVLKFPSPYNTGRITSKDKSDDSYKYVHEKVDCDSSSNRKPQPVPENFE